MATSRTKAKRHKHAAPTLVTFSVEKEGRSLWSVTGQGFDEYENPTKTYRFSTFADKASAIEQAERAASRSVSGLSKAPYHSAMVFVEGAAYKGYSTLNTQGRKASVLIEVGRPYLSATKRGAWEVTVIGMDVTGAEVEWRQLKSQASEASAVALAVDEVHRLLSGRSIYQEATITVEGRNDDIFIVRDDRRAAANGSRARRVVRRKPTAKRRAKR